MGILSNILGTICGIAMGISIYHKQWTTAIIWAVLAVGNLLLV